MPEPEAPVVPPVTPPAPTPERPDWLLSKYKTVDEQAKAYVDLEKKLGAPKPPLTIEEAAPVMPTADDETGLDGIIEKAGLKKDDLAKTVTEKGDLSAEQYAAFKKLGLGKKIVQDTIRGIAVTEHEAVGKAMTECETLAGGKEQLGNLLKFAATLPAPVKEDLNRRLGDHRLMKGAVAEIKAYHAEKVGGATPIVEGQPGGSGPAAAYKTQRDFYAGAQAAKASVEARTKHNARCAVTPAVHTLPRD